MYTVDDPYVGFCYAFTFFFFAYLNLDALLFFTAATFLLSFVYLFLTVIKSVKTEDSSAGRSMILCYILINHGNACTCYKAYPLKLKVRKQQINLY